MTIWLSLGCHLTAAPDDPKTLEIRVTEGEGLSYPIGSRATRGITLLILDDTGKPVDGATVSFRLPEMGPGGTFANGSKNEIVTTHADGRASVWGMKWNRQAGAFDVSITATKGPARAGTVCSQRLAEAAVPATAQGGGSSFNRKWLWIGLAAAAAGAGIAVVAKGHAGSTGCSTTVVLVSNPCASSSISSGTTQIGTPTISLGTPTP
ncbi:MAG TPA: hypothetical protein VGG72_34995 [Bryobacteraceae bacterium]